jgi:hypothetical protein
MDNMDSLQKEQLDNYVQRVYEELKEYFDTSTREECAPDQQFPLWKDYGKEKK